MKEISFTRKADPSSFIYSLADQPHHATNQELLEDENTNLRAEVANLRRENGQLKYWLHRAGYCPKTGERIEGDC